VAFRAIEQYAWWAARTKAKAWEKRVEFHPRPLEHTPLASSEEDVARAGRSWSSSSASRCFGMIYAHPRLASGADALERQRAQPPRGRHPVHLYADAGARARAAQARRADCARSNACTVVLGHADATPTAQ
jgi:hypothetical protein